MSKAMMVDRLAEATGLPKATAATGVDSLVALIEEQIREKGEFRLVGFGTWSRKTRAASTGRNPRTGDAVEIAAGYRLGFKPGETLKAAMVPKPMPVAGKKKRAA